MKKKSKYLPIGCQSIYWPLLTRKGGILSCLGKCWITCLTKKTIRKEDGCIHRQNRALLMRNTTKGWYLLLKCVDGTNTCYRITYIKESYLMQVAYNAKVKTHLMILYFLGGVRHTFTNIKERSLRSNLIIESRNTTMEYNSRSQWRNQSK